MLLDVLYHDLTDKTGRLEKKVTALKELVSLWECLYIESPSWYGREDWIKVKQDYLKRIHEQEVIVYGEPMTEKIPAR